MLTCEHRGRILGVPVVIKPVVVPVPATIIVAIEIQEVPIAVRVAQKRMRCHPYHFSAESYSAS